MKILPKDKIISFFKSNTKNWTKWERKEYNDITNYILSKSIIFFNKTAYFCCRCENTITIYFYRDNKFNSNNKVIYFHFNL